MEAEEDFVGCISCMNKKDLCDLFAVYAKNEETYAQMLKTCFDIKVSYDYKFICSDCANTLEKAAAFKNQTSKNLAMLQSTKDEEYLDESILEEAEIVSSEQCNSKRNRLRHRMWLPILRTLMVSYDYKFICSDCAKTLEKAAAFKNQTSKNLAMLQSTKDEEYLDESILEEAEIVSSEQCNSKKKSTKTQDVASNSEDVDEDIDEDHEIQALDETTCIYCNVQLPTADEINHHVRIVHGLEPKTGMQIRECSLCGASLRDLADHLNRCHNANLEREERQYACHFCDNIYNSKKACFTHLRMKHGLKLCNDHTPNYSSSDRKKCHICQRDFSQKQILNNHLWKAHGYEVEKRKAFFCPLCNERVSYGTNFSAHLLHRHQVREQVEQLEFSTMDDFMLFKSAIQEETKFRFRKTTASKQTIEGVRSHYMCSQSGIYVYQGKGKRPTPERQIYKTGKACPAHMIVTETLDRVLVTFYKTHVGHGTCPYYEPREPKRAKCEQSEMDAPQLICDACGVGFFSVDKFKTHVTSHGLKLYPCEHCDDLFQNIDAWTRHVSIEHDDSNL